VPGIRGISNRSETVQIAYTFRSLRAARIRNLGGQVEKLNGVHHVNKKWSVSRAIDDAPVVPLSPLLFSALFLISFWFGILSRMQCMLHVLL